jgi:hypothetical protein
LRLENTSATVPSMAQPPTVLRVQQDVHARPYTVTLSPPDKYPRVLSIQFDNDPSARCSFELLGSWVPEAVLRSPDG